MIYLNWNWACSESTLIMFRKWKIWGQIMHPRVNSIGLREPDSFCNILQTINSWYVRDNRN